MAALSLCAAPAERLSASGRAAEAGGSAQTSAGGRCRSLRSSFFGRSGPCCRVEAEEVGAKRAVLRGGASAALFRVEVEHGGEVRTLEVADDETILSAALDGGMELPHDCKLGVCMTCPAKIEAGTVDQTEGMLSDDVQEKGYALLCASYPRSDCKIRVIPEEELLSLQLATAND